MATRYGTCNFISRFAAIRYYASQGYDGDVDKVVTEKLADGLINIGKPKAQPGQTIGVIVGEGRYYIDVP